MYIIERCSLLYDLNCDESAIVQQVARHNAVGNALFLLSLAVLCPEAFCFSALLYALQKVPLQDIAPD
jgi:hypothetical protein